MGPTSFTSSGEWLLRPHCLQGSSDRASALVWCLWTTQRRTLLASPATGRPVLLVPWSFLSRQTIRGQSRGNLPAKKILAKVLDKLNISCTSDTSKVIQLPTNGVSVKWLDSIFKWFVSIQQTMLCRNPYFAYVKHLLHSLECKVESWHS